MNAPLDIAPILTRQIGDTHRVEADVDGQQLWFESDDVRLDASMEAFATAMLPSAMYRNRSLRLSEAVCSDWHQNMPAVQELLNSWWRFPKSAVQTNGLRDSGTSVAAGTGLFFTGGVDSFFSLLHSPQPIDHLLYMIDYDVPPHAPQRRSGYAKHLRLIANQLGHKAIVLQGNLRRHSAFLGPSWQQTHGAALIGTAHLLNQSIGHLVVSSSYSIHHPRPCGSHWLLDPLWSSKRLQVSHFGEEHLRFDKVQAIVHHPLVQQFVRPCWDNPVGKINCSICEKCIRTQIVIAACADLKSFTAFDSSESLTNRINGLGRIGNPNILPVYEDFLSLDLPGATIDAINRLIARSRASAFRKRTRQRVRNLFTFGPASTIY